MGDAERAVQKNLDLERRLLGHPTDVGEGQFPCHDGAGHAEVSGAADGVEIDIIESIGNDWGACNSALHWDGYGDDHKQVSSGELYNHGIYDGEFHTFALERTADGYIFYIDGKETWRAAPDMCAPCPVDGYLKLTVEAARRIASVLDEDWVNLFDPPGQNLIARIPGGEIDRES